MKKSKIMIYLISSFAIEYVLFSAFNCVLIFEIYNLMGEVEFLKATIEVLERSSLESSLTPDNVTSDKTALDNVTSDKTDQDNYILATKCFAITAVAYGLYIVVKYFS
jgi:hypothetical protein